MATKLKILYFILVTAIFLVGIFYTFNSYTYQEKQEISPFTKNFIVPEFLIEGELLKIGDGLDYFGNELVTDLNGDGLDDVIFLVTHAPGGSGTFFYVVASVSAGEDYFGTDGYLLGDRIAPQSIEVSRQPRHDRVVVVNYADREFYEPMTAMPSSGKSVYLKLDENNRWGIVQADFEGEVR